MTETLPGEVSGLARVSVTAALTGLAVLTLRAAGVGGARLDAAADLASPAFYPLAGLALVLLAAPAVRSGARRIVLDGAVAGLAVTAVATAIVDLPSVRGVGVTAL